MVKKITIRIKSAAVHAPEDLELELEPIEEVESIDYIVEDEDTPGLFKKDGPKALKKRKKGPGAGVRILQGAAFCAGIAIGGFMLISFIGSHNIYNDGRPVQAIKESKSRFNPEYSSEPAAVQEEPKLEPVFRLLEE